MTTDLFNITCGTFEQMLQSTKSFMGKAREHFEENKIPLQKIAEYRLAEDMMPLQFQVMSVAQHSHGALEGVADGWFTPPDSGEGKSYQDLEKVLADALVGVREFQQETVNGFEHRDLTFKLGKRELPFEGGVFLRTFSLPNFYFHVTATYSILRQNGAPLGKADFLGGLQLKG